MRLKFFSLIVLFLLVISIDSSPSKKRKAVQITSDESEHHVTKKPTTPKPRKCKPKTTTVEPDYVEEPESVEQPVKKKCTKPVEHHVTKKPTTPKPRKCKPKATTVEPEEPESVEQPVKKPCKKTTPAPVTKKPCFSKIIKKCEKVNVGTKKTPKYRTRCRKVKKNSVTKVETPISDWEYVDTDRGSGPDSDEDDEDKKSELDNDEGKDNGGFIKEESTPDSTENNSSEGKDEKQCRNFNVGTKKHPKYRKKCRKVKVDSVTKKTTVVGDWEYEDGDDEGDKTSGEMEKDPGLEKSEEGGDGDSEDGKTKQCQRFNVGTKKHPKYRKKCRKVKVDSVTKKKTVVGDWEYEDGDDNDDEKQSGASKPKGHSGSDGEDYFPEVGDNKPEDQSSSTETTDGNTPKSNKTEKECQNFNVGTKKHPKYRKKCRKVKVDSVTKKKTVVGDWEYEDGDDDKGDKTSGEMEKDPGLEKSEEGVDEDGTNKQCQNFNVGTKKHPKYRKKCRKVKVDSVTKKTTVVGDWEYEDGDDNDEEKKSGASKPKGHTGSDEEEYQETGDGSEEKDKVKKECQQVTLGTEENPNFRRKCRKIKVDSVTKETTVLSDWEYSNDDSDEDQQRSPSGEIEKDPGVEKSEEGVDGDSDKVEKQCENFNVGTKKHPKYRKKCRKVKVDSVTKKTTVVGDWEYEDGEDEKKSGAGKPKSSSTTSSTGGDYYENGVDKSEEKGGITKQCHNFNVGTKNHPKYRKKCRKVKVDMVTKKTTVLGDWEYEDGDDEEKQSGGSNSTTQSYPDVDIYKDGIQKQCQNFNVGTKKHPKYRQKCRKVEVNSVTKKITILGDWEYDDEDEKSTENVDVIQKQCEKIVDPRWKMPNVIYTQKCRKIKVNSVTNKITVISDWEYEDDVPEDGSQPRTHTDTESHGNSKVKQECEVVNIGTNAHPKYRKRCRDVETTKITERNTTTTEWDEEGEEKKTKFTRKSSRDEQVEYEDDQYLSEDSPKIVRKLAYGSNPSSQDIYYEVQDDNVSNIQENSENMVEYETEEEEEEDDQYYEEGDNFRKLTRKSASSRFNRAKSPLRNNVHKLASPDYRPPTTDDLYYGD